MAGTPPPDLNNIDDEAAVEAELRRLKEGQTEPPKPPEGIDTGIPEPEAVPKPEIEVRPESETPPAPTPAEPPKPEQRTAEQDKEIREGTLRRLYREEQRRRQELERQLNERAPVDAKPPEKPKEPTYEEDPAEYLKRRQDAMEAEIQRLRGENQQKDALLATQRAEDNFLREHPDYYDARNHLIKSETEDWEMSGLSTQQISQLAQAVRAGRAGDSRFKGYVEHVDEIARRDAVQESAERNGRTAEEEAIFLAARDTYLLNRGNGVSPEGVYAMAQRRGYKRADAPAEQPKPDSGEAARQRVLQAKEISAATNSLSESNIDGGAPGPKVIRNRNDVLALDETQLDALIQSGRFREL